MRRLIVSALISVALLIVASPFLLADDAPDWATRPGTIRNALTLDDGAHVYLDAVEVDKIKANESTPYFTIRECFSTEDRLVVLTVPSSVLRMNQTIDVEGTMSTLDNGSRAIVDPTVYGYADTDGTTILYNGPLIKGLLEPTAWEWMLDLTVSSAARNVGIPGISSPDNPSSYEPTATLADAPVHYASISDILTGGNKAAEPQSARLQSYYSGISDIEGLPDGSLVELESKAIIGTGTDTIDEVEYKYVDIAEDPPSEDWIRAYYTGDVSATDRVVRVTGQVRYVDTTPVICVDTGPGYDAQVLEGTLVTAHPGTIPYAATLADGATATLSGMVVTSNQVDVPDQLCVQEPGRFAGIGVQYTGTVTPDRGIAEDVTGTMSTSPDGGREVLAGTDGLVTPVQPEGTNSTPYAMTNQALAAGTQDANGAVIRGLQTDNLLVKTCGTVTAVDPANAYFYINDGSNLHDGSNNTGLRVNWPFATVTPPAVGWQVTIVGISGRQTLGTNQIRILQPRASSVPSDVRVVDPVDTTNPTVNITTPSGTDIHLASGATSAVISGTATDSGTGIALVQVDTGNGLNLATYNSVTQMWTYTWQGITPSPTPVVVTVRAYDFAGHYTDYTRSITVTSVNVIYVDGSSSNALNGANHGGSWSLPYSTVGYALTLANGTKDIWVAKKTYTERITLKANVGLYGGFIGGETCREQRNWAVNRTILDGNNAGSVVTGGTGATAANTVIDGFTIQNGTGTYYYSYYSSYYYGGGGIYFNSNAATVSHNIIKLNGKFNTSGSNYSTGAGIYCSSASPVIANNWIVGNASSNIGGAIYASNSSPSIVNNTIAHNSAVTGGAVHISGTSSPTITNNIIALNSSGIYISSGTPTVSYNDFWSNAADPSDVKYWSLGNPETNHNISADPLFINSPFGELHIKSGSPCKDAGLNPTTPVPDYMLTDLDGDPRQNGQIDMGADEWNGSDPAFAPYVVRVSPGGDDSNGDSWAHAKKTIQKGIDAAYGAGGGEVWVKGSVGLGIAYSEAINLRAFVHVYGGFDEGDTAKCDRNWHDNITAIDASGLSLPVVTVNTIPMLTSTLDGFTITHGDKGVKLNCGSATIAHNIIKANATIGQGGGIYASSSYPVIANNWIVANAAYASGLVYNTYGGGVCLTSCPGASVLNNTVAGNNAGYGSIYAVSCPLATVTNNIVALNQSGILIQSSTGATANNNDLYSNPGDWSAFVQPGSDGNIEADPGFVDAAHCDFHITGSGCKDLGLDTVSLPDAFDIDGDIRRVGTIDVGADEWNGSDPTPAATKVVRVKPDGNDSNSGESWSLAKQTLQKAVDAASDAGSAEVWVKGSPAGITYNGPVVMRPFVYLYGGFDESDSNRSDRDWGSNVAAIRGSGNVVTISTVPFQAMAVDGFTVQGGATGIYVSSASGIIAHNIIKDNTTSSAYTGAGIYCNNSSPTIANNFIVSNSTAGQASGGGLYLANSNAQVLNNTIAENTGALNGQLSAGGIYVSGGTPTIMNNIVACNSSGVYLSGTSCAPAYNDVWGNTVDSGYWLPDTVADGDPDTNGNIIKNPRFFDPDKNMHILWDSGCRDAGLNDVVLPDDTDIDAEARRNGTIDIGADETSQCYRYSYTLTASTTAPDIGASVPVVAYVFDSQPAAGYHITFSVTAGEIVSVTQDGETVPVGAQTAEGITGTNGQIEIIVRRTDDGEVRLVGTMTQCAGNLTRSVSIDFYNQRRVGFIYDLCLVSDYTPVRDYLDSYLSHISSAYPKIAYQRMTGTPFSIDGSLDVIFLSMPTRTLQSSELSALSAFVSSGRRKRVVLIGEYGKNYSAYNGRLNTIASYLGIGSRFNTGSAMYDGDVSLGNQCRVNPDHYLTQGVSRIWDAASDTFQSGWQSYARPIAYLIAAGTLPWIIEEDTVTAGSRVLIHDDSMFVPTYDDSNDTVPDKNFKFVRNLCVVFPQ